MTQTFTHLKQCLDEPLDDYLHHSSEFLLKIYHTSNMPRISAEDTNHNAVVYGLNCRKLKDSMARHGSAQWKKVEECFRDMHNISVGYK